MDYRHVILLLSISRLLSIAHRSCAKPKQAPGLRFQRSNQGCESMNHLYVSAFSAVNPERYRVGVLESDAPKDLAGWMPVREGSMAPYIPSLPLPTKLRTSISTSPPEKNAHIHLHHYLNIIAEITQRKTVSCFNVNIFIFEISIAIQSPSSLTPALIVTSYLTIQEVESPPFNLNTDKLAVQSILIPLLCIYNHRSSISALHPPLPYACVYYPQMNSTEDEKCRQ